MLLPIYQALGGGCPKAVINNIVSLGIAQVITYNHPAKNTENYQKFKISIIHKKSSPHQGY